jgi:hypothetical protein
MGSALSGWRLLRLYRIWGNTDATPVWASQKQRYRKQQEAQEHSKLQAKAAVKVGRCDGMMLFGLVLSSPSLSSTLSH